MRTPRPAHLTVALAVVAIVLVAGAPGAPATVASGARCPPGTESAVITAYANVFSRATQVTADARAASLARGDDPSVRAVLDTWLASPVGASSTITVDGVRCRSRTRVVVDAALNLAGNPLPDVLAPGRAVLDGGTWKVATSTFCLRMVLENPALAEGGTCARNRR